MTGIFSDLRFALRALRHHPSTVLVAILTLALGIGANSAFFSVIHAKLFQPLPFRDAGRLVGMWESSPYEEVMSVSVPNYEDWRAMSQSFDDLAAYRGHNFTLTGVGDPVRIGGAMVSGNLFELLGLEPHRGRLIDPSDETGSRHTAVVLGHGFWQRRFGADPGVVGSSVLLDGEPFTVVGVAPIELELPSLKGPDVLIPLAFYRDQLADRGRRSNTRVVGRLADGVSPRTAAAEMATIAARLEEDWPGNNTGVRVGLAPLHEQMIARMKPSLLILWTAVGFVLLIACVNVTNLLLARTAARRRELAIRKALGAGGVRLLRQLLVEGMCLAGLGAALGVLLALWGTDLLRTLDISGRGGEIRLDAAVIAFTALLASAVGALVGLVPALQVVRSPAVPDLKLGASGTGRPGRTRNLLALAEIAFSLFLLVAAGLMINSLKHLNDVEPGFDTDNLWTAIVALPEADYPGQAQRVDFFRRLLEEVEALPGARSAAAVEPLPLLGSSHGTTVVIDGHPPPAPGEPPISLQYGVVSRGYFETLGIPVVEGRVFDPRDGESTAGVVVVDRALAERYWPGESPVSKRLRPTDRDDWLAVVGMVGTVRDRRLSLQGRPRFYFLDEQNPLRQMSLAVRTAADPGALTPAVRRVLAGLDPNLPLLNVKAMTEVAAHTIVGRRYTMWMLTFFAVLALVLAAVGIFSVFSWHVAQSTREIGVRMALGARRNAVVGEVLRRGLKLAGAGVVVGCALAWGLCRFMEGLLYGVSPSDPRTFVVMSALLVVVALAACFVPARRAASVDPIVALRTE